ATPSSAAKSTLPVRAAGGVATRPYDRLMPLAGGFGGVALAAVGEMLVEGGDRSFLSLLLYLAGIALFAVSAWRVPPTAHDLPPTAQAAVSPNIAEGRRAWIILGGGVGLALVLNLVAVLMIREHLNSVPGLYLWLLSLLVVGATGIAARRLLNWAPRWGVGVWPMSRNGRLMLLAVVVLILVAASAS